jgi:hypothetical protein
MSISALKVRVRRAVLSPLRPAFDRVLDELAHRQELSASATQESLEALAAGTRLLRGSVLELADDVRAGGGGEIGERALLRAAALGAVAASGRPRRALAVGEEVASDLAALGIEAADADGDAPVELIVAVTGDLAEAIPVERLAAGGTLVLALGAAAPPARVAELTAGLEIDGSAVLAAAGAAFDAEPNDPSRGDGARLIVARRPA